MLFNSFKIKRGDTVKILVGKDKAKTGRVERIIPKKGQVLVEGVNQYKRHFKGRSQNQKSEIITITKPLAVSSVALICPKCKKPTRVGFKFDKGTNIKMGKKIRTCKKCRKEID
jgi:large subunit ribosomal protein L24